MTTSLGNASGAYTVVTVADGGMTIDLEFVKADNPTPSFEADIEKAAGILSTEVRNHITVNLSIGYGEVNGQPLSDGEAAAGPDGGALDSYSTVRTDLIDARALAASTLPTGSSIDGESSVAVWSTQEKLFGQLSSTARGIDGSAGFATYVQTITGTDVLVGVALHELTHALGRVPYGPEPDIFDFYCFTSPGTRLFSDAVPAPAPAYFSIDGGVKAIADYGVNSDPSDFLNTYDTPPSNLTPEDPFDEYYDANTLQTLTSVDIKQLRVLGFKVSKPASSGSAALAETGGGSPADFLEQYGSAYAPAPSTPANAGLSFDAWNALGSSGGADPGGFGFHGNIGGARDAWGVSVAWSGPIGHGGPGS